MNSELLGALSQSGVVLQCPWPPAFVLGVSVADVGVVWPWATNVSLCTCEQLKGKQKNGTIAYNHGQSISAMRKDKAVNSIASAFRPPLSDCLCPRVQKKNHLPAHQASTL